MSHKYKLQLRGILPEGVILETENEIETKTEWYGRSYGMEVGRIYADGKMESLLKHDGEGSEWFDRLLHSDILLCRTRNLLNFDTGNSYTCRSYYLMYDKKGHPSALSTVTDDCLDTCINVQYRYTYEILLVEDECERYIYQDITTYGPYTSGLFDQIESLEIQIEEWAENEENGFSFDENGDICCKFYDRIGETVKLSYPTIDELLMKMNSARIIKLNKSVKR